ncbi:MAG: N-acetylmuramoyl-L-alanine amidase [Myxococcota bacterium]|jgi:N-acetylmuramoyl-L-alanine amidase
MMFLLLACATDPTLPPTMPPEVIAPPPVEEPAPPPEPEPEPEPVIPEITIIDKPIPFSEARKEMTRLYLATHWGEQHLTGDLEADITMVPRMVVLHWTAGPTAKGAFNTFSPERLPGRPELQRAGALNVSAHFVVDRDGTIWRLMPEDRVGRHVIGLNHLAIGIENAGGNKGYPLTDAQVAANIDLVRYLTASWPTITHLIGHMEYQDMEGHPYFQETDPTYRTIKPDPGADFLARVRAEVVDLGLEGVPD